jgi:hypothetical protein
MKKKHISLLQALYYSITGLWPIADIHSFMAVTGPKTDIWLVKMVGLLTVAIALAIVTNYKKHEKAMIQLGVYSATAYTAIDTYYSLTGVISKVYLSDAVVELVIILLLLFTKRQ